MADTGRTPAQRWLDGEDVLGDYVPNDFLLFEDDLDDGLAWCEAFLLRHASIPAGIPSGDQIRAAYFILRHGAACAPAIATIAGTVMDALAALSTEKDARGIPCAPVIDGIDDNVLSRAWEIVLARRAGPNRETPASG